MAKELHLLLKRYIEARGILNQLEDYREEQRDIIMSGHYPSYYKELEFSMSTSVENTAIDLIMLDERIERTHKACLDRVAVLERALDTLTYEELSAFERVAWNIPSHVPKKYEMTSLKKVFDFTEQWSEEYQEELEIENDIEPQKVIHIEVNNETIEDDFLKLCDFLEV